MSISDFEQIPNFFENIFQVSDTNIVHMSLGSRLHELNTLRTGDADLRFYITTVQDV